MPTIPPTISPAPDAPQRGDRNTFSARVDAFLTWLIAAVTQFGTVATNAYDNAVEAAEAASDAGAAASSAIAQVELAEAQVSLASDQANAAAASAASAVSAPGTAATSATSHTIAAGSVTVTIQPGKAFVVGQFVVIAATSAPANFMAGQITAYDTGSGALTVDVSRFNGLGVFADWTVSVIGATAPGGATGDILYTANPMDAPNYLPCDGSIYIKASYPALAAKLGTLGLFDNPIPIDLPTGLTATGAIYATTWSPDGQYLVAAGSTLRAMKRSGETLVNLTIASGTANTATGAAFDKGDGTYLGEVGGNYPYVKFHKRTGDTFAALSDPASLPPGACTVIDCSPDGVYWAVATIASPYLVLYKRTGDAFVKLSDPATMPGSSVGGLSFSPDGLYLAVTTRADAPYIRLYQRSGDAFTALTFPGVMPTGGDIADVKFDPTGRYLAVRNAASYSKAVFIYDRLDSWAFSSATISAPSSSDSSNARMAWSADGKYLLIPDNASFELRDVVNQFALLPTPSIGNGITSASPSGPSFSPDNMFLILAGQSGMACGWKRRYDPTSLFSTPRITGAKAYIKT